MSSLKYRPDIDGLRALAILPVIAFHLFPNAIPGGFVGVDVFFVISGFLISQIIISELKADTFSLISFYARRVKRLFPSLLVVFSLSLLYGYFVLLNREFQALSGSIFYGSLSWANFYFFKQVNYFDVKAILKPFLHLWSLAVEEQFYMIYPCLLWIGFKNKFVRTNVIYFLLAFFMASFCLNVLTKTIPKAYFMPYTRFWEIMLGAILAFLSTEMRSVLLKKISSSLISFLGCVMIISSIFIYSDQVPYPGVRALLPTLGAVLLIMAGAKAFINRTVLSNPISVFIGKISYPLYLIHWPLISFVNIIDPAVFMGQAKIWIIILSFIISIILYYFVEKPIRESKKAVTKPLVVLMVLISALSFYFYKIPNQAYVDSKYKEYAAHIDEAFDDWDFPSKNLRPLLTTDLPFYKIGSNKKSVLFVGDSNIQQYAPRIEKLILENDTHTKSAIFATIGGYLPIQNVFAEAYMSWRDFMVEVLKIAEDPGIDSIVIGAAWIGYLNGQSNWYIEKSNLKAFLNTESNLMLVYAELENMIQSWLKKNKKVYIVLPMPSGGEYCPKTFFKRSFFGQWSIDIKNACGKKWEEYSQEIVHQLKLVSFRTGAEILNPGDHLCKGKHCLTHIDGKPLYKDSGHLRPWYVKEHMTIFDDLMRIHKP